MRAIWFVLLILTVAAPALNARAQINLTVEAQAKALFDQGIVASDEERWADAAVLFEQSRALLERPSTIFNLLGCLYRLGRYEESLQLVQRYLVISDPVADAARRQETEELRGVIEKAQAKSVNPVAASVAPTRELPPVRELEPTPTASGKASELGPRAPLVPDDQPAPNRGRRRAIWITGSLVVVGVVTASLLLTMREGDPNGPACGADTTAGACIAF
jgi:tetratricopeptide (TPR) repeat protein